MSTKIDLAAEFEAARAIDAPVNVRLARYADAMTAALPAPHGSGRSE